MVGRGSDCSCVLIENGQWSEEDPIATSVCSYVLCTVFVVGIG